MDKPLTLLKLNGSVYKIYLHDEPDKIYISLLDEHNKKWSIEADLPRLIEIDPNWKKFELPDVKEILSSCLKNSKFELKIEESYASFNFIVPLGMKELKLNIKLICDLSQVDDEKEDEGRILLREIENLKSKIERLESKKKYQIISKQIDKAGEIIEDGILEMKYSSEVEFKVTCSYELSSGCIDDNNIYFSYYNNDLKETIKEKLVFRCHNHNSTLSWIHRDLHFSFIEKLSAGKNKITLKFTSGNGSITRYLLVKAKIL
jgi:hypothetical protein